MIVFSNHNKNNEINNNTVTKKEEDKNSKNKKQIITNKKNTIIENNNDNSNIEKKNENNNSNSKDKKIINNSTKVKKNNIVESKNTASSSNNNATSNSTSKIENNNDNTISNDKSNNDKVIDSEVTDPNDALRKEIENKYSIRIYYKDEKSNYSASGYSFTKIYDDNTINQFLKYIDTMLSKYPSGFLNELNSYKKLEIYMVSYINNNAAALTDNLGSTVVITLWCKGYIDNAFHHEMMHYIDCILGTKIDILNSMTPYNPNGFLYGNENNDYTIIDNYNQHYFISSYSKRNYLEDRGVLFGDMMTSIYKKTYYNAGEPINEKAKLISEQLKQYFNTVTSNNNYWDRYISR